MLTTTLTDERTLATLESDIRPLLAEVQAKLADAVLATGPDAVTRLLADAPLDACVRLAETWSGAAANGVPPGVLRSRFPPEDHALIELVAAIYAGGRVDPDYGSLASLLDEAA